MTPPEGWSTKAKEAPSYHEAMLATLDINVLGFFNSSHVLNHHMLFNDFTVLEY